MANITRLGAYGGARPLYGDFSGKSSGPLEITPTGIASAEAFGTAAVTTGVVYITPTGIAGAEAFGTAVISSTVDIAPTGIASVEAFGTAVLSQTDTQDISPTGIASDEAFGTAVITGGATGVENKFGKNFYADQDKKKRKALTLQMRQEDEEILALVQIIGRLVL
tara:strand:- start:936 stop:1433 length:498 start_codon:yes stop_codon:yes gene_type:complete